MKSVPGTTRQACAYESGQRARRNLGLLSDNPHNRSKPVDRDWWIKGFKETAPHTCKFCGAPSWIEPEDQTMPPDYCHEGDHGDMATYWEQQEEHQDS